MLGIAVDDDDVLVGLVQDIDNIANLTSKQQTFIRNKCLYIKKLHELALQHLNTLTWKECCSLCIVYLADTGIHFIKNEKVFGDGIFILATTSCSVHQTYVCRRHHKYVQCFKK